MAHGLPPLWRMVNLNRENVVCEWCSTSDGDGAWFVDGIDETGNSDFWMCNNCLGRWQRAQMQRQMVEEFWSTLLRELEWIISDPRQNE